MHTSKAKRKAQREALLARVEEWKNEHPAPPYWRQPTYRGSGDLFFGAFYPFAIIGFLIGMGMTVLGSRTPAGGDNLVMALAMLWMPFVVGFGGPLVLSILISIFSWIYYKAEMRAWHRYREKFAQWKESFRQEFQEDLSDWEINHHILFTSHY